MAECANEVPLHERHDLIDENADFSRLLKHIAELEQENSEVSAPEAPSPIPLLIITQPDLHSRFLFLKLRKKASQVEFFEGEAKRHKHSVVGLRNLFKRFLFLTYIRDFKVSQACTWISMSSFFFGACDIGSALADEEPTLWCFKKAFWCFGHPLAKLWYCFVETLNMLALDESLAACGIRNKRRYEQFRCPPHTTVGA